MPESLRMQEVQAPIIPIVGEMIAHNPGTISLGQGVVHYGPPAQAIARIDEFLGDPANHKYHAVRGIPPLLEALGGKLSSENGITVGSASSDDDASDGRRLCVTAGANMAFMNAVLAIADPGDEVILPTPYYFNQEMAIRIANCRPVLVATDEDYQPDLDAIADAITDRTRAIVTISPNNPTGAVYPESTLRAINRLCHERGVYHISDEAYEYFTYGDARHFSPGSIADGADNTISLFSFSKAYGFASWRIGYMVYPTRLDGAIAKIQDTILICPPLVSQYAALGALEAGGAYCRGWLPEMAETRDILLEGLDGLGDRCVIPPAEGAFYFLLRIATDLNAMELTERLIRDHGVAVIPGQAFGVPDGCYLRVSYGPLRRDTAAEGVGRLARGLEAIV